MAGKKRTPYSKRTKAQIRSRTKQARKDRDALARRLRASGAMASPKRKRKK